MSWCGLTTAIDLDRTTWPLGRDDHLSQELHAVESKKFIYIFFNENNILEKKILSLITMKIPWSLLKYRKRTLKKNINNIYIEYKIRWDYYSFLFFKEIVYPLHQWVLTWHIYIHLNTPLIYSYNVEYNFLNCMEAAEPNGWLSCTPGNESWLVR